MSATVPSLGTALVAAFDDETIRALADRLRPYLQDHPDDPPLITPAQAAERLNLHPKTVERMARDGRLPAVKIGTGWRFHADELTGPPRASTHKAVPSRSRPRQRDGKASASVRAIRGEKAASGRGGQ